MTPNIELLKRWAREETLVRIVFADGENLVSKGYIRASPLECLIVAVRAYGIVIRENGALWLFRFARVVEPSMRGDCPVLTAIEPVQSDEWHFRPAVCPNLAEVLESAAEAQKRVDSWPAWKRDYQ